MFDFGSGKSGPSVQPLPTPIGDDIDAGDDELSIHPTFEPIITQATPPPSISGGTLILSADGVHAYAADPDRDALYVVDLNANTSSSIALAKGDEPGRVIEDSAGKVHVALRGSGMIADIDPKAGTVLARRAACVSPRGIAFDATSGSLFVACRTGELVTLPAAGGASTRDVVVAPDLRDLVVVNGRLFASTFRSASVMEISAAGTIANTFDVPSLDGTPSVLWRLEVQSDGSGLLAIMQVSSEAVIQPGPGSYGMGGCGGAVSEPAVVGWGFDGHVRFTQELPPAALPVDVTFDSNQQQFAAVLSGEWKMPGSPQLGIFTVNPNVAVPLPPPSPPAADDAGVEDAGNEDSGNEDSGSEDSGGFILGGGVSCGASLQTGLTGQAIAAVFRSGTLFVQTREPAAIVTVSLQGSAASGTIPLSGVSREDTGHDIFHSDQGGGIACATCHAEGGEDGRTWVFGDVGPRRTPTMLGTIAGTAPYHWQGEELDLPSLYLGALQRMNGLDLSDDEASAFSGWLDALPPAPAAAVDPAAVTRGHALFTGSAGCATCHSGAKLTNNLNEDVGTNGAFQVPSLLGVGWRAPYMHDGCGKTLLDAFTAGSCSTLGPQHIASGFTTTQISDLETYLRSL